MIALSLPAAYAAAATPVSLEGVRAAFSVPLDIQAATAAADITCHRVTARRVNCEWRIRVTEDTTGVLLAQESGSVAVTGMRHAPRTRMAFVDDTARRSGLR